MRHSSQSAGEVIEKFETVLTAKLNDQNDQDDDVRFTALAVLGDRNPEVLGPHVTLLSKRLHDEKHHRKRAHCSVGRDLGTSATKSLIRS